MEFSLEAIKQAMDTLLKTQTQHREAIEKNGAHLKTISDAQKALSEGKFADSSEVNDKITKLNKIMNGLEDKIKTLAVRKKANEIYGTQDGLAQLLSTSAPAEKQINYRRLAKSILDDPHAKEYKKAFFYAITNPNSTSDAQNKLLEVGENIKNSSTDPEDSYIKKALTTIVGEQAGYFCPPEIDLTLQKTLYETSPIRRIATVRMTTRGHYQKPIRTTLPTVAWGSEELAKVDQEDEQKYQLVKIPVNNLNSLVKISYDMLEDSIINIEQELINDLTEAVMLAENTAFMKGTGLNRPRGILDYAAQGNKGSYNVNKPLKMEFREMKLSEYNGADGTVHLADALLDLNAAVLSAYKNNAYYLISRGVKNIIRQIKDKNNQYLYSTGQNWGGVQGVPQIRDGISGMINGYGVVECDDMEATLKVNTFPVLYGNFRGYVILDRIGLMLTRDNITTKGFMKYWFRKRVGGGFTFLQAVKALKVVA